ncbi:zinc transporter ZntB [Pelagimonas varians]|uniref:Zinc transport protein ZntB n=1 Tax=Pelagimonas varians TaxID=696760 RepID=A0A238JXW4_9RHOB|nr:zinc transporter ZntB [Pelagimonas varians]PYG33027.1 zinc transporter [Pelagimonas varians]SMX35490.1 Zinc transport protein ZntB [Pelagimonas varians]
MTSHKLSPIAAFDIQGGNVTQTVQSWPHLDLAAGYRWLHLDLINPETVPWITENLPEIAAKALWQEETRPRCERHDNGLILNLRAVNLNPGSDPEDMVSLRMWVTKSAVVTARTRKVWAADAIRQSADKGVAPATVGLFLAELTHGLAHRIEAISLGLEDQTDLLEETVLGGDALALGQLGNLRQTVIKMRRFINPQREAVATLAAQENWIFSADELAQLRETSNKTRRIVEELDATRDRLAALQEFIDAERTHALSRNSYILSVVAAIFLPLGFLTGLFGINVAGMPGTAEPLAFWFVTGGSAIAGIALFLIFKLSKWL